MTTPHRLYVGTIGEGLFRSTDGGTNFVRACEGMFVECHVRALATHPDEPLTLYLGSEQGLYRSDDGADHWSLVDSPLNGQQIWSIAIQPSDPPRMIAGTCPSRLFHSLNGGRSWSEVPAAITKTCPRIMATRVTSLLFDPDVAGSLWAGIEIDGVWRSQDGGKNWLKLGTGLSSQDIHSVEVVGGDARARHLLASTNNDLNLSTNGGETWQPLGAGKSLPHSYFRALARPYGKPGVVLAGNGDRPPGSTGTIARSTDGGRSWAAAKMPGPANSTIWNFATHPADPNLIYASSVSGEIYRSWDAGESWEKIEREFGEIRALAWTPTA